MLKRTTFKILLTLVVLYALLVSIGFYSDKYLNTDILRFVTFPFFFVYIFSNIGIPGLLENNGHCGWGLCEPTFFGWSFIFVFWLFILWLVSWGLSKFIKKNN